MSLLLASSGSSLSGPKESGLPNLDWYLCIAFHICLFLMNRGDLNVEHWSSMTFSWFSRCFSVLFGRRTSKIRWEEVRQRRNGVHNFHLKRFHHDPVGPVLCAPMFYQKQLEKFHLLSSERNHCVSILSQTWTMNSMRFLYATGTLKTSVLH